jgi:hypothetical protein
VPHDAHDAQGDVLMTMTTVPEAPAVLDDEAAVRHERLVMSVRSLRTRVTGDDTARTLLILGGILLPLGLVLIVLGWSGASRSVDEWEQIPYLISGGVLGLALVVAGGFCYFTYWQTQVLHAVRRDATDTKAVLEALERIEALLAKGAKK